MWRLPHHHPHQVKRGLLRCLFDRARTTTTGQNSLRKEHHLTRVLRQNGYPSAFIRSSSKAPRRDVETNEALLEEEHRPMLVILPYTEGVIEDVRRVCRKIGMKAVFKSGQSLRSMLTKVKAPLMMEKKAKVVYRIPCSCGEAYIGETVRRLETRVKEHRDACHMGALEKSASAEHALKNHHSIKWEEVSVVDRARTTKELLVKEAIHIRLNHHPSTGMGAWSCLDAVWLH